MGAGIFSITSSVISSLTTYEQKLGKRKVMMEHTLDTFNPGLHPRRSGKSYAMKIAAEAMLDTGKRVLFVTPRGSFLKRRKGGHLTLIKKLSPMSVRL